MISCGHYEGGGRTEAVCLDWYLCPTHGSLVSKQIVGCMVSIAFRTASDSDCQLFGSVGVTQGVILQIAVRCESFSLVMDFMFRTLLTIR